MTKLPSSNRVLRLFVFCVSLFLFNFNNANAQCNNTSPYSSATLSTNTGASGTISCHYAGEYGTWNGITAGYGYTTTSSLSGDYITVRSGSSSGTVVAHGLAPLTWVAQSTSTHYIHINTDAACGTQNSCRNVTSTVLGTGCSNTSPYSSATLSSTVTSGTISCHYAGEYGTWNGIVSGSNYTTTSNNSTDFLTIRSDSSNGPIVAFGTTPVTWNALTTDSHYIHVNTDTSCGTQSSCRNVTTTFNALCPAPNGLISINLTTSSADLIFNETGSATQWQIELDSAGVTSYFIVTNDTTTNSSLSSSTSYTWKVRAICGVGDTSGWSVANTFATACDAFIAPYLENFDGLALTSPYTALPTCWGTQTGPDYWDVTNDLVNTGHSWLPNIGDHTTGSANYMWIDASSNITANEMESPMIDMSNLTVREAGFWFASNNTTNNINHTIALDAWDGSAWINIATESGNFSSWEKVSGILPTTIPDTSKFRIYAIADPNGTGSTYFYNDLGVDDFFVIEGPSCPAPISLMADSITSTSAVLYWSEVGSATSWQVEYGPDGFAQGSSSSTLMSVSSDSLSVIGLSPISNYQFYVRSVCGAADTSTWSGPLNFTTDCAGPLSGTYILGGASADFNSFTELSDVLSLCGIGGAVTVNVAAGSGPYTERFVLSNISGLSATNALVINGNGETIQFATSSPDYRIVGLDGVKHVTIDNLIIKSVNTSTTFGLHFTNGADSNTIQNCTIDMSSNSTNSTTVAGIVFSGSFTSATTDGNNGNYNTISNNTITGSASGGPYYGMYLNGQGTGADCYANIILNNNIENWYSVGIYLDEVDSASIEGNDISSEDRSSSTTRYGIRYQGGTRNITLNANAFRNFYGGVASTTSTGYGIYFSGVDAPVGSENVITNNIVGPFENNGDQYGIYNSSSNGMWAYHNTIGLYQGNPTSTTYETYGIYQTTTASNINIENNIIYCARGGNGDNYVLYFNATASDIYSNNNVLYTDTTGTNNYIGYYSGNQVGLGSWQNANTPAFDSLSLYEDPFFLNLASGDLEPNSININDLALPIGGVVTDFNGVTRSNPTDHGAIEFDVLPNDVAVISFVSPESTGNCQLDSQEVVSVIVKNNGSATATAFSLSYSIDNGTPVSQAFSGFSLATNESDTFTFTTTANLSASNSYDIEVIASYTGDADASNDTAATTVTSAMMMVGTNVDFENENGFSANLNNGWITFNSNSNTSNPRWQAQSGFTGSGSTGPSGDHSGSTATANGGGKYMFLETSSPAGLGDTAYLESGCINLAGTVNPAISFWYHMYGAAMGNLYLDAYDGASWIRLDSIVGQQQPDELDLWERKIIRLCDLSGFISIRFAGAAGTTFTSDMAIDDVSLIDLPDYNDEVLVSITDNHEYVTVPLPQIGAVDYSYSVAVKNNGTVDNSNVQVNLNFVNGPSSDSINIGTHAECSDDSTIAFAGPYMPVGMGMYYADASVSLTETDSIPGNNMMMTDSFAVVDSVYAREDGTYSGGIGNTLPIEIGQIFHIGATDTLTQLSTELGGAAGDSCRFKVYSITNGAPDSVIMFTEPFVLSGGIQTYTEEFCNYMVVPADTYFVAVEQMSNNNMSLTYSLDHFIADRVFYGVEGGVWTTLETAGFPSAVNIRAVFGHERVFNGLSQDLPLFCAGSTLQLSTEVYADYAWSTSDTTQMIDVGVEGMYYVTVTSDRGCTYSDSVYVEDDTVSVSISGTTLASCGVDNGTATAAPVNGFGTGYSYMWQSGDSTQTAVALAAGTYDVTVTDSIGCDAVATANVSNSGSPSIALSVSNVICGGVADGEVTSVVTGGLVPYDYAWSNGSTSASITSLDPGSYTLTITDSLNCVVIADTTVLGNDTLQFNSAMASDISCFGFVDGAVNIDVEGGVTPYSFSWNTGATTESVSGLGVGGYTLSVVDSVGCTLSGSWSISQPTALTTTVAAVNSTCNGDDDATIALTTTGGVGSYSYAWSNSATTSSLSSLSPGTYNYTVTDSNGCLNNGSQVITEPTVLAINTVEVDASCYGGTNGAVTANVGGGTPNYTYSWSTGGTASAIVGLTQGSYSLTVTDNNSCTATVTSTVDEPQDVSFVSSLTNVDCNGNSTGGVDMSVFGGTMPYSYSWTSGATTEDLTNVAANTYGLTVTDANSCTYTTSETVTEPTTLVFTLDSSMNINCFGDATGAVYTTASGGTMPYGFAWSNGAASGDIMNVMAGTYTVTLTDGNGCTETNSETLTENAILTSSVMGMDEGCIGSMDGSASVTIGGGVTPYTYSWNNSATGSSNTNIGPGTYMVTATDSVGCTIEDMVTISYQFELPVVSITGESEICGDETTMLDGGAGFSNYTWSNGDTTQMITGDATGTYSLMVVDVNGCMNSDSFDLTVLDLLTLDLTTMDETCFGDADGMITANVGGGVAPYNYTWNDPMNQTTMAATDLGIGDYMVDVVDSKGCTISGSDSVSYQFDNPVFSLADSSLAGLGPFVIDAGAGFAAYQWNIGVNTQTITVGSSGNYAVVVTDGNGCSATDTVMVAIWPTGVEDVEDEVSVSLYPNPTNGVVNIDFSRALENDVTVKVMSMNGTIISQEKLFTAGSSYSGQIELNSQAKGMYMIELTDGNFSLVKRIIVH